MFTKKRKGDSVTYGIIGLGRFGQALALELAAANEEILVMDREEEKVRLLRDYTENAYVVRNLDKSTLSEMGVQNCDIVVVCIGEEMDSSILTTLHLKGLGVPRVIVKAASLEHGEILEKLGAEVVYPERDMAIRLAHRLETAHNLDFVQLSERVSITKLMLPDSLAGKTVLEADLRKRFGANIIAIENGGQVQETILPEQVFRKGDILFLSGSKEALNKLSDWAKEA